MSPHRFDIEQEILCGSTYVRALALLEEGHGLTVENLSRHFQNGHVPGSERFRISQVLERVGQMQQDTVVPMVLAEDLIAERLKASDRQSFVYLLQFSDRIKIGYTTNPRNRFMDVPHDRVLALFPGTRSDESRFQKMFAHLHVIGEWFTATEELFQFADEKMRGGKHV
jgi:hypothetical protein